MGIGHVAKVTALVIRIKDLKTALVIRIKGFQIPKRVIRKPTMSKIITELNMKIGGFNG